MILSYKHKKILLIGLLCFFSSQLVYSQSKEKLQSDKKKIEQEIAYTNKLLSETKKSTQVTMGQLVLINNQIKQREQLIRNINAEIRSLNNSIETHNKSIEILKKELSELKEQYARMIYYAYKNKSAYNRLMFIFSASDFNQAYKRMKYMQQYSEYRKKQAEQIVEKQQELEAKLIELELFLSEKKDLLSAQNKERSALDSQRDDKSKAVAGLRQKEQELSRTLREKEAAAQRLQKAIETIIAEEIRKAAERARKASSTEIALTPEERALSNNFVANKGKLPWPLVRAVVTNFFGEQPHPVLPGIKVSNKGVDMATTKGAKVRAVFDGSVIRVIEMPMYRNVVIVSHGEYFSVYSKLDQVYVKVGDKVKTRQDIGLVYTNNEEGKTELHFQVWKGSVFLDPLHWLAR